MVRRKQGWQVTCRCHPSNRCGRCDEPRLSDMELFAASWLSVAWAMVETMGHKRHNRYINYLEQLEAE